MINQFIPIAKEFKAVEQYLNSLNINRYYPFSTEITELLEELSQQFMQSKQQDLIALGFWLRPTEIKNIKKHFMAQSQQSIIRVAKGVCFHVIPSNVETMFIYSWVMSLLAGNYSVIKISNQASEITNEIINILSSIKDIDKYLSVIKYDNQEEYTAALSQICDVRIVWGGDETVQFIRGFALKPKAEDLLFPDRFSYAMIDAEAYLNDENKPRIIGKFYKDMYLFNQQACSSPKVLIWVGEPKTCYEAKTNFYRDLSILADKIDISPSSTVIRDTFSYSSVMGGNIIKYQRYGKNLTVLTPIDLSSLNKSHCGHGLLYDFCTENISATICSLVSEKDQTLSYFGFSKQQLQELAIILNGRGIDRIVPIGSALNFYYIWDGIDLLSRLTKFISVL